MGALVCAFSLPNESEKKSHVLIRLARWRYGNIRCDNRGSIILLSH